MRSALGLLVLLAACDGVVAGGDDFWSDTQPDTGADHDVTAQAAQASVAIDPGTTDHAELIKELPVARSEHAAIRRIALQLGPDEIPRLQRGDRLIVPAEVQATTRCDIGQVAPGCNYDPNVSAQLILSGDAHDARAKGTGSRAIATQTQRCTKSAHHCMFVFTPAEATLDLDGAAALPCLETGRCYLSLVMWAWSPDARANEQDKVIVGGNNGDYLANGKVDGDVSRLMVVRERGVTAADRASRETSGGSALDVNTNANPVVLYSHRLAPPGTDLKVGEQFLVEAHIEADTAGRARVSTQLILAKNPDAADGNGVEAITPGQISEQNGFNCTGACTLKKVAVFRVDQPISGAVYVNVVAKAAVPGGGSTRVTVKRDAGWVRSIRYDASLAR